MTLPYVPKVYDVRPEGHGSLSVLPRLAEGDLDKLQAFYKFQLDFTYGYERAQAGQLFWGIDAFELKAGPAVLQPQVRDLNNDLITTPPGILLFLYWPGAPDFPQGAIPDPPYATVGVASFTEGKGDVGWGFGGESHIGDDGGPFAVWASSDPVGPAWPEATRRVGSDAVKKLGWWDDHIIPNPIFRVMRKPGSAPPPLPPSTGREYLVNVDAQGNVTGYIAFTSGPPPSGTAALGLWRDGQIVANVAWWQGPPPATASLVSALARLKSLITNWGS
jgi:hypothetical protein